MESIEVSLESGTPELVWITVFDEDGHYSGECGILKESVNELISKLRKFQTPTRLESPVE